MSNATEKRKARKRSASGKQGWREKFGLGGVGRKERTPFYKNAAFLKGLLAVGVVLVLSILVLPDMQFVPARYQIGSISPKNIKAPRDFDVPDLAATEEKRLQVVKAARSVYDFDLLIVDSLQRDVQKAFTPMNRYYLGKQMRAESLAAEQEALEPAENAPPEDVAEEPPRTEADLFEESFGAFKELLDLDLSKEAREAFDKEAFSPETAAAIGSLLKMVMTRGVVGTPNLLSKEADKGIIIRGIGETFEKQIEDVGVFLDVNAARETIRTHTDASLDAMDPKTVLAAKEVAAGLVAPNLTFNRNETELRKIRERDAVKTVFFKIQKGEMIVREGERITEDHVAKLNILKAAQKENNPFSVFSGLLFFNAILLAIFMIYINRFKTAIAMDLQKVGLLGLIIVGSLALVKAFYWIARGLMANLEFVEPSSVLYAIPFAVCGMLIGVLFEVRIFILPILIISILSGVMLREDLTFTLYALVGNFAAALSIQNCRRRSALLRGGLIVGAANVLAALSISMVHNELSLFKGLYDGIFAFSGGLLASVLVSWMVPLLEGIFKITTDIRLLELSDTNQEILKDLLVHAPGTYQHSLMVGNLSEEAAEAIGANPLLARVSSLYHDIGKIHKAEYFVENQINVENRHDKLTPSMSTLVLTSHVKDGVELAREHKVPRVITDIIQQHHGTSVITYFYQKAKEQEDPSIQEIKEEDYRYLGPKPQTKEAGIVMIADSIEAASRVLTHPTPAKIEGMVNKIMERIYLDGQLDECDLTLKDLRKIKKGMMPILTSIYHQRIDYPSVKLEEDRGGPSKSESQAQPAGTGARGSQGADSVRLEKSLRNRT
jgi:putative nucleotidyltransferase with HDIG domain